MSCYEYTEDDKKSAAGCFKDHCKRNGDFEPTKQDIRDEMAVDEAMDEFDRKFYGRGE